MMNQTKEKIRFTADFDSGALNVAETRVEGDLITLAPRRMTGNWEGEFAWIYFMASGVKDLRPRFRFSTRGTFMPFHDGQRFVFSIGGDNEWTFFDNGGLNGGFYEFSHGTPFGADTVYIAYGLPYPYTRTQQHTAVLRSSKWVTPTSSADEELILGRTAGTEKGGYRDDLGREMPSLDIYGYRITEPDAAGAKQKIVLTSGNHSGEHLGNYALEGMVDFLISGEAAADELRRRAEFYIYPQTNPEGRYAGYYRSNPENPHEDHNRHWKDPSGFTDITLIRQAMMKDTGGNVDYFIDFHCQMKTLQIELYILEAHADCALLSALLKLEPDIYIRKRPGSDTGVRTWSQSAAGLSARISLTPEIAFLPGALPERYRTLGKNYGLALAHVLCR